MKFGYSVYTSLYQTITDIDTHKINSLSLTAGLCLHSLWGLLHITHPQDQTFGHSSQVWGLPTEHSWQLVG